MEVAFSTNLMTAERSTEIMPKSAHKHRRDMLMDCGGVWVWLKFITPGFEKWLSFKSLFGLTLTRTKAGKKEAALSAEFGDQWKEYILAMHVNFMTRLPRSGDRTILHWSNDDNLE